MRSATTSRRPPGSAPDPLDRRWRGGAGRAGGKGRAAIAKAGHEITQLIELEGEPAVDRPPMLQTRRPAGSSAAAPTLLPASRAQRTSASRLRGVRGHCRRPRFGTPGGSSCRRDQLSPPERMDHLLRHRIWCCESGICHARSSDQVRGRPGYPRLLPGGCTPPEAVSLESAQAVCSTYPQPLTL